MGSLYEIYNSPNVTKVRTAEYHAAQDVRAGKNTLEAASISLQEFSRTMGNSMRIEAASKEYNEAVNNTASALESRTTGKLNASLTANERLGALAAQAGAMGVGGSAIDLLSDTVKLQRNIEQDLQGIETKRLASSSARGSAQIMDNAFSSMDLSQAHGNFDYTINIAPVPLKYRYLKMLGVAAATYFGGPQAGQAAADAAVGEWKANNGDYAAAGQYFGRAASGLISSVKDWGGGSSDANSWFGAVTQRQQQGDASDKQAINWGAFEPNTDGGSTYSFGSGFGQGWDH
jgi:hypothetical protein